MNAEEIAALAARLAAFNEWRRGMDSGPQPDPRAVGVDLDAAIAALRAMATPPALPAEAVGGMDVRLYGCHSKDAEAARARALLVQEGWNPDGTRRMGAHYPKWAQVNCGHVSSRTDPACAGCKWRPGE